MDAHPHDDLIRLLKLSRSLLSTRELDKLLVLVVRAFVQVTEADRAFLLLTQDETLVPVYGESKAGKPIEASERISSLAQQVWRDGVPIYSTNLDIDAKIGNRASINELGLHMVVCVPLRGPLGVVGVIYADGKTTLDTVFTTSNKNSLEALADHAGAAIENAHMFESAIRDPLTNLFNFGYFQVRLGELCEGKVQAPAQPYVAYLELDDLVGIAARLGPEAADQTLVALANELRGRLVVPELAARVGATTLGLCLMERSEAQLDHRLRALVKDCSEIRIAAVADPIVVRLVVGAAKLDKRLDSTLASVGAALREAVNRDPPLVRK